MKTKKYLFLMLAAALFAACGDDDDDNPNPTPAPEQPSVIEFADYAEVVGMSYSAMYRQFGDPEMAFGDFYMYGAQNGGKVESLTIAINSGNDAVWMVMEQLAANAYKEEDIVAYFASKYRSYGSEEYESYDEDGNVTGTVTLYSFGNADSQDNATLLIEITGNQTVNYSNPQNVPTGSGGSSSLDEMTPNDAVISFLLHDVEDIEEEYPGVFMNAGDMYMTFMEDNPYLAGIAFTPVEGFVTALILLYNEDLTDEDIIAYYEELGYTATKTGEGEDGDVYTITNGIIMISYSAGRAEVIFVDED